MDASSELILLGGLLLTLSVFAGLVTARLGAPLLLAFLGLGMLAGEDGPGRIAFGDFRAAYLIGSLALAVILFEGGISTKWAEVRNLALPSSVLATVGVAITGSIVGAATHYGFGISWVDALLLGAVVAPTDAAAVASLLHIQQTRLRARVAATLEIESGLNDPMSVFATLVLVELTLHPGMPDWSGAAALFGTQMAGGLVAGFVGGQALLFLFRRLDLSAGLYPILGLAGALTVFGGAQIVEASGFLATYIAAVILGNGRYPGKSAVDRFFGSFAWLSQIVLFLMLGLLVTPRHLAPLLGPACGVAAVLIFVARPAAVALCLLPFRFSWREILFISWVGLRGAVPIFLAIVPVLAGVRDGALLFGTAFIVVMVSLLIQGWTVAPLARWLRLERPLMPEQARQTIELPETLARSGEIAGYRVVAGGAAIGLKPSELPLPPGGAILLTVRDGVAASGETDSPLAADDYVLIWARPEDMAVLDRIMSARDDRSGANPSGAFGEFAFPGHAALSAILAVYGQKPPRGRPGGRVADYLKAKIGRPSVGDRIRVGAIELIIREMAGDAITSVGIEVDPLPERPRKRGRPRKF